MTLIILSLLLTSVSFAVEYFPVTFSSRIDTLDYVSEISIETESETILMFKDTVESEDPVLYNTTKTNGITADTMLKAGTLYVLSMNYLREVNNFLYIDYDHSFVGVLISTDL